MSKNLLIYPSFAIAFLLVVLVFLSATTYSQLGVAITLYPLLAFFAYKILLDTRQTPTIKTEVQSIPVQKVAEKIKTSTDTGVADIDKRTFLKLIGATGISFFLVSIFGRKVESLLLGQNTAQAPASTGNAPVGNTSSTTASPTDAYNISEVDDNVVSYYGFIDKEGAWFIMKGDANTGSFRYSKGKSNFPSSWNNRQNLKYDYFYEVFSQS